MQNRCKVVMLPTNQKAPYSIGKRFIVKPAYKEGLTTGIVSHITSLGHSWSGSDSGIIHGLGIPQHLYILSNDKPKEGDWIIYNIYCSDKLNNFDTINEKAIVTQYNPAVHPNIRYCKKIIASTDSSLYGEIKTTSGYWKIPSIPQSFIDKYVSEYNKGHKIEEVMVEYQYIDCEGKLVQPNRVGDGCGIKLKLNPDNTINIGLIKDSWTRDEVIKLLRKYYNDNEIYSLGKDINSWIKENL